MKCSFATFLLLCAVGLAFFTLATPFAAVGQRFLVQAQDVLSLAEIVDRVQKRYKGTVIDADIVPPKKKKERGPAVYEVRLLTDKGNVIRVRLDARTGEFLSVDGHGFLDALRQ